MSYVNTSKYWRLARVRISFFVLALFLMSATATAETLRMKFNEPMALPALSFEDEKGALAALDTNKSQLTLLHFWATWCVPCIAELPEIDALQARYTPEKLKVITVSMDEKNIERVQKFYTEHGIKNLPIYMDSSMAAFQALKLRGLPASIWIDAQGRQIARMDGPMDWDDEEVKEFLQKRLK